MTELKKILLFDDNPVDRELTTLMLLEKGYAVLAQSSAEDFLGLIEREKPALILLDILMPEYNGNDVLKAIREKYSEIELPVIMVTSKTDANDVIESLQYGANDFITKPVHFEVALRRIQTHISISEQSRLMAASKELNAVHAMIVTYNHEINNPLFVASVSLNLFKKSGKEHYLEEVAKALQNITDIVKKTTQVLEKGSIEYEKYADFSQKLDLTKMAK